MGASGDFPLLLLFFALFGRCCFFIGFFFFHCFFGFLHLGEEFHGEPHGRAAYEGNMTSKHRHAWNDRSCSWLLGFLLFGWGRRGLIYNLKFNVRILGGKWDDTDVRGRGDFLGLFFYIKHFGDDGSSNERFDGFQAYCHFGLLLTHLY
jgi:hypothetical protein